MSCKDNKRSHCSRRRRRSGVVRQFPRFGEIVHLRQSEHRDPVEELLANRLARDLAAAVVCQLGIPDSRTIVGLLGVGRTKGNHDEVERWVARHLTTLDKHDWSGSIDVLCRRLVRALNRVSTQ